MMKIAKEDDVIQFERDGLTLHGKVLYVYQNSVCVDLTIMPNFEEINMPERTVVNNKKYKIESETYERAVLTRELYEMLVADEWSDNRIRINFSMSYKQLREFKLKHCLERNKNVSIKAKAQLADLMERG